MAEDGAMFEGIAVASRSSHAPVDHADLVRVLQPHCVSRSLLKP
jgi:hypothetical protein